MLGAADVEVLDVEVVHVDAEGTLRRPRVGAMTRQNSSPRRYPRTARINEVVREVLAEELERMSDPRLSMVTVTGVDVTRDLRQAKVYYAALGREDEGIEVALRKAAPHLRGVLGRQVRLKYLPELQLHPRSRDRAGAAGGGDPALHPRRDAVRRKRAGRRRVSHGPRGRQPDHPGTACDRRADRGGGRRRARRPADRAGVSREPRRRRARLDARPAPRAAHRGLRCRGVVPHAVPRRAALPRAPRARAAHAADGVPLRTRRDDHLRLRLDVATRRPRARREGCAAARRHRPPRVQPVLRLDQPRGAGGGRERRRRADA